MIEPVGAMPESGPARRPALVLLRAGAVPGAVAGALVAVGGGFDSGAAAGSALVGAALALAGLSAGPLLMAITRHWSPPAVMASAVGGYGVTVGLLAVAYEALGGVGWLAGGWVGGAIVAVALAWPVGQAWAVARLRVLAYGGGTEGDAEGGGAGQNGSPASPFEAPH